MDNLEASLLEETLVVIFGADTLVLLIKGKLRVLFNVFLDENHTLLPDPVLLDFSKVLASLFQEFEDVSIIKVA